MHMNMPSGTDLRFLGTSDDSGAEESMRNVESPESRKEDRVPAVDVNQEYY